MALATLSWIALAIIVAAIAIAWTKRLPGFGVLALANVIVHFIAFASGPDTRSHFSQVQRDLVLRSDLVIAGDPAGIPGILGHMFLHANFSHLLGNMLILIVIGFYLDERIGPRGVLVAYLGTGIVAALAQTVASWDDLVPMLGASGACFGLIGTLAAGFPKDKLRLPVPVFIIIFLRMEAWMAAIVFGALQFMFLYLFGGQGGIAYWAHLGGLGMGLVLGWTVYRGGRTKARRQLRDVSAFATSGRALDAHARWLAEDEPDVAKVWWQRFLHEARCPRCSTVPVAMGRGLVCPSCGYTGDDAQTVAERS